MMIYKRLALNLDRPEVISLVGAGGKTSLINGLSLELKSLNKRVLSTTTTQIFRPNDVDYYILGGFEDDFIPEKGTITSYGNHENDGKLVGKSVAEIDDIINRNIFDFVLIEADGSKRKPLKAPAKHEPVITDLTTMTIGLIGLDSIGQELNDSNFHRAQLISKLTGKNLGEKIVAEDIINLILDKEGTFKDSVGRKVLILNKADSIRAIKEGKNIRNELLYRESNLQVLICNLNTKEFF